MMDRITQELGEGNVIHHKRRHKRGSEWTINAEIK